MSYANGTQYYNLPQTVGTDKRDWFDTNAAFAAVDAALHAAVTGQAADAEAISTINASLATDEAAIAALQTASTSQASQISTLQTTVNGQATQIADVRQDAEDMITANNEGAAATSTRAYAIGDYFIYNDVLYKATAAIAIGDTIVPNTNCEATNVDTEITAVKSALYGEDYVSVTGDSVKTTSQLLNSLVSLIDYSKITDRSYLKAGFGRVLRLNAFNSGLLTFSGGAYNASNGSMAQITVRIAENASVYAMFNVATDGTVTRSDENDVHSNTFSIELHY